MRTMRQVIVQFTCLLTFHLMLTNSLDFVKFHEDEEQGQYKAISQYGLGYSGRVRRSANVDLSGSSCNADVLDIEAKKKITKVSFPLKDDKNMDLQVEFVGENNKEKGTSKRQLLLTTMPEHSFAVLFLSRHESSKLYQSQDDGRTFQRVEKEINSAAIKKEFGIMLSPLDRNRVILVSMSNPEMGMFGGLFGSFKNMFKSNLFSQTLTSLLISTDGCKTFRSVKLPFQLRDGEPLLFHPKNKDWIIALERKSKMSGFNNGKSFFKEWGHAYISKDFGSKWKKIMPNVVADSVKWGASKGKEGDEIFISAHEKHETTSKSFFSFFHMPGLSSSETLALWRSTDGGENFEKVVDNCYKFGVEGNFVFASVKLNVSDSGHHEQKRVMHLSSDGGTSFHRAFIPQITENEFYAVLDMQQGMIFLHVDNKGNTGKGTLFISGSDGLMYTKSLENHFYTNVGYHDFTKIESMPGVYITQQLKTDNTLTSLITFDRGVSWQPMYVDKKYCNNTKSLCSLHYHKTYTNVQRRTDIQGPLSHHNAPGIILVHGQAGDALTGIVEVWMSVNGGYNWTKVADHPHHYAIADSGNLIVIVPRFNNTGNILKYSIDQGTCWQDFRFADDNQPLVVHGLATEPNAKDRKFSLWGYLSGATYAQREWVVKTVNFHDMFNKKCSAESDFDNWSPHLPNGKEGCFLGKKLVYRRTKSTVACYLGSDFNSLVSSEKCPCTKDDMECDYGYVRNLEGECKKDVNIRPIEICKNGEEMKKVFTKGYRRVPGDVCSTKESLDRFKFIDEKKRCDEEKEVINSFGIVSKENHLKKELENGEFTKKEEEDISDSNPQKTVVSDSSYQVHAKSAYHPKRKGSSFLVIIAVLAVIGVVGGIIWYGKRYMNSRSSRPSYIMSDLADDDNNASNEVYNPRPKTERPFKDEETDAEDDVLLQV